MDVQPTLGAGRDATVVACGEAVAIRRYRSPGKSVEREAPLLAYLALQGFPVPRLYAAWGRDLVLERVPGPSMARAMAQQPRQLGHVLGRLHAQLHHIDPPDWLSAPYGDRSAVLHLDLHPFNVLMGAQGPVVIDWANAVAGPPELDVALTWLLLGSAPHRLRHLRRRRLLHVFLSGFLEAVDAGAARGFLPLALERRLRDGNVTPKERRAAQRYVRKVLRSAR